MSFTMKIIGYIQSCRMQEKIEVIVTIDKWGNSQGIRFPKELLEKLHVKVGPILNVEYEDGRIILEPLDSPPKYNIHDLVQNIKADDRMEEVKWGNAEGKEVW